MLSHLIAGARGCRRLLALTPVMFAFVIGTGHRSVRRLRRRLDEQRHHAHDRLMCFMPSVGAAGNRFVGALGTGIFNSLISLTIAFYTANRTG
jgi:hypothetical protein